MARTRSGNARTAPMHLRTTPQFRRYVEEVCAADGISISTFMREAMGLVLELRKEFAAAAAAEDLPLSIFVKRAVKAHIERTTP
jgi:hypothetical protein